MSDFALRMGIFFTLLTVFVLWQWRWGRSALPRWQQRWRHNFGLLAVDSIVVRMIQPLILLAIASLGNHPLPLENWLTGTGAFITSLVLLDFTIYWQHRLFHRIPLFWRLHRVHHSDPELDVSSAIRFHPVEILLSLLIKGSVIWLFGISPLAVLTFDILLNGCALFNHTNARLPQRLERLVRRILVTPDMHRIHHSRVDSEAHSNFGFCLSIWDRLFQSYTATANHGDAGLNIGLPGTQTYAPESFKALLLMPLKSSFGRNTQRPSDTPD